MAGADRNKLVPTDIGIVVNDFLMEYFPDVLDYNFTAGIEKEFDIIAEGEMDWTDAIDRFYKVFHPTVERSTTSKAEHKVGERELGIDPKSGHPVYVKIGRFGPMAQLGAVNPDDKDAPKPQFAPLQKGQSIETITLPEALKLFDLPRTVGDYEGKTIMAGVGRFGPFVRHDNKYISIPKQQNPLTISLEESIELIKGKREKEAERSLKTFDGAPDLELRNGRYGPYIAYQGKNYKLPPSVKDPKALALTEVMQIITSAGDKPATKKRASKKQ
jgi:DNA topoisomerase-1